MKSAWSESKIIFKSRLLGLVTDFTAVISLTAANFSESRSFS